MGLSESLPVLIDSSHAARSNDGKSCSPTSFANQVLSPQRTVGSVKGSSPVDFCLLDLSSELLMAVLEQLSKLEERTIFAVRLVCRTLHAMATPIAYRTIVLNKLLAHPNAWNQLSITRQRISAYTSHVVICNDVMPTAIRGVLSSISRLSSITLRYVQDARHWSIADALDYNQLRQQGTKIYVENLPLGGFQNDLHESLFESALTRHVVSLKLATPSPPLTTKLDSLKRLLLQCPSLRTLQYEDVGRGTSFAFEPGERLPAVHNLVLKSYDWIHSANEVEEHWDLSSLRSLSLVAVPVSNFLRSTPPQQLRQLRSLRMHDSLTSGRDRQEDATRRIYYLVHTHVEALRVLDVTCHTRLFPIDAILRHGKSLVELRFRDHVGFEHDDDTCPTLCLQRISALSEGLPSLRVLELDMDTRLCRAQDFLQAVSAFPRLHTLVLHTQTLIHPTDGGPEATRDRDAESSMQIFMFLLRQRERLNYDVPWRSISINVGGWQKVMTRRVGAAWRGRNARGVFAERCFVLGRDEDGRYNVHEEQCYDGSECFAASQL